MLNRTDFVRYGNSTELVVILHGFSSNGDRMVSVADAVQEALPHADIFMPRLPFSRAWWHPSLRRAESIVAEQMRNIDALVAARAGPGGGYGRVSFVGHSFGAVLARRLVITAFGEQVGLSGDRPAPFEPELQEFRMARPWAGLIGRLVLLAGMSRGWSVSSAMNWFTSFRWGFLQFAAEVLLRGRPTIMAIRRGAPFLVQTRLQWLALMDPLLGPRPQVRTVQLLGTIDDQVSPDDNVDYSVDLTGAPGSGSYFYIELPFTNHRDAVVMPRQDARGAARRRLFVLALTGTAAALAAESVPRSQMADSLPPEPDLDVTDLVFVIHGIRDKGFWTQKVARSVKQLVDRECKGGRRFESWTESYGYFPMLPFMLRSVRQRKVEWLMDRYAEARARYPQAAFHYVGHSNGTYLAAQALRDYAAARFHRIVFAGSVVRRDYDWMTLSQAGRVESVLNYVATSDWVVALFPKGVQPLRWFNLGSAGHDGFEQAGPVHNVRFIRGSHSAGHEEEHWQDIARFVVHGALPAPSFPPLAPGQGWFYRVLGRLSMPIFLGLIIGVCGIGIALLAWVLHSPPSAGQVLGRMLLFLLYVAAVSLGVTRF